MFREGDSIEDLLVAAEGLMNSNYKPDEDTLRKILEYILLYETLPSRFTASDLSKNATFATSLTLPDGSFDSQPLRVRASPGLGPRSLHLNLFVSVVKGDVPAANGESTVQTERSRGYGGSRGSPTV